MAWWAALVAALGVGLGGLMFETATVAQGATPRSWSSMLVDLGGAALAAALVVGLIVDWRVGRRLRRLTGFLEEQARRGDDLRRLPPLGDDEVGRAAAAVNALFASMTSLRVDVIEKGRELAATQEELRLKNALAAKTQELEQRLRERALLFDVLRISSSGLHLDAVLEELSERLRTELRLREFAILLRDSQEADRRFVLRAVRGFDNPGSLVGRSIVLGEGIAGEVAEARRPIVIPNVSAEPQYLAFWGAARRDGSFAAFPLIHRDELLGLFALTRPPGDPLSDVERRLLAAIADSMALAIRHAILVDELRDMSTHDELTGLANRRLLRNRLELELERARRYESPLSVLAIDIDHFKMLNDRCGHATGDAALRQVAAAMRQHVRKLDTVARVGGEEFVVVLPRTGTREAAGVAEKLRRCIAAAAVTGGEGQPHGQLTVSIGLAGRSEGDDIDPLLSRADQALYLAKQLGRNRVELAARVPVSEGAAG